MKFVFALKTRADGFYLRFFIMSGKSYKKSENHKKKLSIALKDYYKTHRHTIPGNPFKKGNIPWTKIMKGRFTPKHLENLSKGQIGVSVGSKNGRWRGGVGLLTKQIRASFKYRQWRSDVFTKDNFICVLCGKKGGRMEIDHYLKSFSEIFYENKIKTLQEAWNCEELWNINNGRTLCEKCHNKITKDWWADSKKKKLWKERAMEPQGNKSA